MSHHTFLSFLVFYFVLLWVFFFICLVFLVVVWLVFETGFLCVALAVLEYALRTNSEICLSLLLNCWD